MMRCSKCGENCRDNQAFCLKCGNPIQVVPDFNLIEAELANNIGKLLDETEKESKSGTHSGDEYTGNMRTKKIAPGLDMEIQVPDISRKRTNKVFISDNRVEGEDTKVIEAVYDNTGTVERVENKVNKKRVIIMSLIIIMILAAVISLSVFVIGKLSDRNNYNKATFSSSYANAENCLEKGEYEEAIKEINIALAKAANADEKIKARVCLEQIYVTVTGRDDDRIKNLIELTKLCPSEPSYFRLLAEYYTQNGQFDKLSDFLISIENDDVYEALDSYTTKTPMSDRKDGLYSEYFDVVLIVPQENVKIYYAVHKIDSANDKTEFKTPTAGDTQYNGAIAFKEEGTYILTAVAISASGVSSRPLKIKYEIALTTPDAPVMTPKTGEYTERMKIAIEVPDGAAVYYAFDDEPLSEESKKYTEPFDMLIGAHVVKAYLIDKYGLKSKIAQESYTLKLTRNYNTVQAKKAIIDRLKLDSVILNDNGDMAGSRSLSVEFASTGIILNAEYHIYTLVYKSAEGSKEKEGYMAVDCNTGMVITLIKTDKGYEPDEKSLAEIEALKEN